MLAPTAVDGCGAVGDCSGVCEAVPPSNAAFGDAHGFAGGCFGAIYLVEDWLVSSLGCHAALCICSVDMGTVCPFRMIDQ